MAELWVIGILVTILLTLVGFGIRNVLTNAAESTRRLNLLETRVTRLEEQYVGNLNAVEKRLTKLEEAVSTSYGILKDIHSEMIKNREETRAKK